MPWPLRGGRVPAVSAADPHTAAAAAAAAAAAESRQLCLALCNPMGCSPPGYSVHGMLQARILEWVAVPSSRESSRPRDQACVFSVPFIGR